MFCQNLDRKDAPSIYVSYSSVLESALKYCFSAMEPCVVHSTNEFLSATNKGCSAYSTEKQHDLSVLMPQRQSVCRLHLPKAAKQNWTTRFQTYPTNDYFL